MKDAGLPRLPGFPKGLRKESLHKGCRMHPQEGDSFMEELGLEDMDMSGHVGNKLDHCAGSTVSCPDDLSTQICHLETSLLSGNDDDDVASVISIPELLPSGPARRFQEWQSTGPAIPWQAASRIFYPWLAPIFCASVILSSACAVLMFLYLPGWRILAKLVSQIPWMVAIILYVFSLAYPVMNYVYHYQRLRDTVDLPEPTDAAPLIHAVVVCAYKEPLDVLHRTIDSIVAQRGLGRKPIVVFASEARDPTAQSCFEALSQHVGSSFELFLLTKHELKEGEAIGKSSNENWAVQELHRLLIHEQAHDPFEVMITIVDADSILSSTYLAHTEASFRSQRDGRRLIYNGPLNVYRNFGDAKLLVQCYELGRCHGDLFHDPLQQYMPQSNYSLTLGLCHEIDFWTPDVMPEDIHTCNKVKLNNFGSWSTVAIPSLICNDLVTDIKDRYTQAKRHQYGSITEFAWVLSLYNLRKLSVQAWAAVLLGESGRAGSFLDVARSLVGFVLKFFIIVFMATHWADFGGKLNLFLIMTASVVVWKYVLFWLVEFMVWDQLMRQFPVKRPSAPRWCALILFMPVLSIVCDIVFFFGATLDGLWHITFKGELAYVCAPKGDNINANTDTSHTTTKVSIALDAPRLLGRRVQRINGCKDLMTV